MLKLQNISIFKDGCLLLNQINLTIKTGEMVGILGPNGAGKSTLIKSIAGDIPLSSGKILLNNRSNWLLSEQAMMMSVLPQFSQLNFPFIAEEVVLLGRTPFSTNLKENKYITRKALQAVDALSFKKQNYTTLSGGEKQRIHIARVLAQIWQPTTFGNRFLLLDEPVASLDLLHQHSILSFIKEKTIEQQLGVLFISHDLNLAARYCDHIAILKQGELITEGKSETVFTPNIISKVFHIDTMIMPHPKNNYPMIITL